MTVQGALDRIAREMPRLREAYPIKRLGIFGSFARGEQLDTSDVDILVEFERPIGFFAFVRLEDLLSGLLGRQVDLVSRGALKGAIAAEVLSETSYVQAR